MKKITTVKKTSPKKISSRKTLVITPQKKKINFLPLIIILAIASALFLYIRFGIVATVNGKPISRLSYLRTLEKMDQKQTLKQMTNEALIYQEAVKKNIVIEKDIIDTEIASVEAQIKQQGQTLEAALSSEGMTRADLEDQIRLQKTAEKLANPNLEITQAQIDDYLTKNKSYLPETYTKEQLQELAKTQLITEIKNTAINSWFTQLQKDADIVIR